MNEHDQRREIEQWAKIGIKCSFYSVEDILPEETEPWVQIEKERNGQQEILYQEPGGMRFSAFRTGFFHGQNHVKDQILQMLEGIAEEDLTDAEKEIRKLVQKRW